MFSQRFPRGGPRKFGDNSPLPPWLLAIHAANRIEKIFGQPTYTGQREGVGYVEVYEDADVIFPDADPLTVKIVAKTERGDRVLKQAVEAEGKPRRLPKLREMKRNPNVSSL